MVNKKILIITYGFYPEQSPRSFRATELAKEFCRQGHYVTVMAPYRKETFDLAELYGFKFNSLGNSNWKIPNFSKTGFLSRVYNKAVNALFPLLFEYPLIEYFFKVSNAIKRESISYDLLISIAHPYPIHWGVAANWKPGKKNVAKKWVADCGDPYSLQENVKFKPPFYFHWIEKWFMRKADFISVPTKTSYLGYFSEFHSKIIVITQGFKFEDYSFKPQKNKNNFPVFAYAGLFITGKRDPSKFCEYLLETKKEFRFHIYTRDSSLIEKFRKISPNKFIIHDFIPRNELLKKLKEEVDFVVNFENVGLLQTPSKLIDYIIIDKPILSVKSFELDKKTIDAFLNFDFTNSLHIEDKCQYQIENVAHKFLSLI